MKDRLLESEGIDVGIVQRTALMLVRKASGLFYEEGAGEEKMSKIQNKLHDDDEQESTACTVFFNFQLESFSCLIFVYKSS